MRDVSTSPLEMIELQASRELSVEKFEELVECARVCMTSLLELFPRQSALVVQVRTYKSLSLIFCVWIDLFFSVQTLKMIVENDSLIMTASADREQDQQFVAVLCHHIHPLLLDDNSTVRELAMAIWGALLRSPLQSLAESILLVLHNPIE